MRLYVGKDLDQDFCREINAETKIFKRHRQLWYLCGLEGAKGRKMCMEYDSLRIV